MNSNNYEAIFGESLSNKIIKLKKGVEGPWNSI